MKIVCKNNCFEDGSKPGFDADALADGLISVKLDEQGEVMYVNEDGYDNIGVGKISMASLRCGACGDLALMEG